MIGDVLGSVVSYLYFLSSFSTPYLKYSTVSNLAASSSQNMSFAFLP